MKERVNVQADDVHMEDEDDELGESFMHIPRRDAIDAMVERVRETELFILLL